MYKSAACAFTKPQWVNSETGKSGYYGMTEGSFSIGSRFVFAMTALGETSRTAHERARTIAQSPELWKLCTPPPRLIRSWNAEGWYVVLKDSRLLAFTTEYRITPPEEVTDLFHELEKLPASENRTLPDVGSP